MSPLYLTEATILMRQIVPLSYRRRRRPDVESQPARCPRCEREMIAYVARNGPAFHCGCDERKKKEGKDE